MKIRFRAITALAAAVGISTLLHAVPAKADSVHIAGETTTYYTLSNYYGIGVDELMNANKSVASMNIYPGLKLTIPRENKLIAAADTSFPASVISTSLNVEKESNIVQAWGKNSTMPRLFRPKLQLTPQQPVRTANGGGRLFRRCA